MRRGIATAIARSFRRARTPLCWYYIITIGVPVANGAAAAGTAFVEHTLFVLMLPAVIVGLIGGGRELVARNRG